MGPLDQVDLNEAAVYVSELGFSFPNTFLLVGPFGLGFEGFCSPKTG